MGALTVRFCSVLLCKLVPACFGLLMLAMPTFGFCFQPHPTVQCDFLDSDAVFIGKVTRVRAITADGFTDGWYYDLHVIRLFRGPSTDVIEVYTGNDSGRYPLEVAKEYLIFASINEGKLTIGNCDDSAPLSQANAIIRQIQKLAIPKDAIVEGQVALHLIPSEKGLAGVQILIRGKGKTYAATTDDKGRFSIHVPPGAYSAEAKPSPGHSIVDYDLSYDGPDRFAVKAGHCAGLQFVADTAYKY